MKLFLVRHAEGESVVERWQTTETHLSERGRKEADVLGKLTRFKITDKIISSNWKRAAETASIVAENLKKQVEIINGIEERHQSSKICGFLRGEDISRQYLKEAQQNRNNWDWKWDSEEESYTEMVKRSVAFRDYLLNNYLQKNLIIFSHEEFIRLFISTCLFGENSQTDHYRRFFRSLAIEPTGISLLIYREETKVWKLWYLNDYSHLGFVN